MSSLKTLKDLYYDDGSGFGEDFEVSKVPDLRDVAREWIKEMDKSIDENNKHWNNELNEFYDSEYNDFHYVERWIKHFFNLEDEE